MLGTLRFALALMVLLNHLWEPVANKIGSVAVIGFFTVSGFLITRVITEVYGDGFWGGLAFAVNRLLRIYPCYLVVIALSTVCFLLFEVRFGHFYSLMKLPVSAEEWVSNLTLINIVEQTRVIVPPAWSLTVELIFYGLMILLLSRSRLSVWIWLAVSCAIMIELVRTDASFGERYYSPWSASLWFALGALLYVEPALRRFLSTSETVAWGLLPIFCLFPLGVRMLGFDPHWLGFYGSYLLFLPLFATSLEKPSMVPASVDRYLGDLAYPMFVGHFMVGGMIYVAFGNWIRPYSSFFAVLSIILTIAFARIYITLIDDRIQAWRENIRPARLAAA